MDSCRLARLLPSKSRSQTLLKHDTSLYHLYHLFFSFFFSTHILGLRNPPTDDRFRVLLSHSQNNKNRKNSKRKIKSTGIIKVSFGVNVDVLGFPEMDTCVAQKFKTNS